MKTITAVEMAKEADVDAKKFREALRRVGANCEDLKWHQHNARWIAQFDSKEHEAMKRVLNGLN